MDLVVFSRRRIMVGGKVIENALVRQPETRRLVRRIWCIDRHDECAVYADPAEAEPIRPGDSVWWQSGQIFWTPRDGSREDVPMKKIGFSFDPRG